MCLSSILLVILLAFQTGPSADPLFEELPSNFTGIDFKNTLVEGVGNNILETEFFYNGGGVAVGDLNGDELPDIYFTANQGDNALYINEGNFQLKKGEINFLSIRD